MTELQYAYRSIKPAYANIACSSCNIQQYDTALKIGNYVTENSTINFIKLKHAELKRRSIRPHLTLNEELKMCFGTDGLRTTQ